MGPPSTLLILLHLSAFAQLGVLSRIIIGKLFSGACSVAGNWSWAPCVTGSGLLRFGGALFYDFPVNVVGSFLIGLFTAGSTLALKYSQVSTPESLRKLQLSFLPSGSSLQGHVPLHFGLRTGYCGSLTTFSSWMLQVVVLMVGRSAPPSRVRGTEWVAALWAIFLGVAGPLTALIVGQHTALAAAALLERAKPARRGSPDDGGKQPPGENGKGGQAAGNGAGSGANGAGAANGSHAGGRPGAEGQQQQAAQAREGQKGDGAAVTIAITGSPGEPPLTAVSASAAVPTAPVIVSIERSPTAAPTPTPSPAAAALVVTSPAAPSLPPPPPVTAPPASSLACRLVDAAAVAVLLTLTGVSAAYAWLDRDGPAASERRFWWLAILLGPPGCVARWYLSRFNSLPSRWRCGGGGWSWLQLGTFAANLGACCLNFVAQALLFRLGSGSGGGGGEAGGLSGTQRVALQGLMVGTAGCLSTVSTWVVELELLSRTSPAAAYKYGAASVGASVVLGLLVYGIPAWTAP